MVNDAGTKLMTALLSHAKDKKCARMKLVHTPVCVLSVGKYTHFHNLECLSVIVHLNHLYHRKYYIIPIQILV